MCHKIKKKYPYYTNKSVFVCKATVIQAGLKMGVFSILFFLCLFTTSVSFSQSNLISLEGMRVGMSFEVFVETLEAQSDFSFVYNSAKFQNLKIKSLPQESMPIESLLNYVLTPIGLNFIIYRDKIIIKERGEGIPMTLIKSSNLIEKSEILRVEKIVLGRVLCDDDSQPIVGASIRVRNQVYGTASDKDGYYNLKCNVGDTLLVTAIGFVSFETVVGLNIIEDIRLKPNMISLKEVNVIGYGEEETRELLGAVSSISPLVSGEVPNNFDDILAGSTSGLWFQKSSGAPGSASTIAIRGVTSLQPDANSPLIVVDGVPLFSSEENLNQITVKSQDGSAFGLLNNYVYDDIRETSEFRKNALNMVNPEDIESVSVLKDAYSTSIYGSRGAAGVILITTKKPKKKGISASFLYESSLSKPVGKPELMNANEYASLYSNYYSELKNEEVVFPNQINTNWYDLVVRNAVGNKLSLAVQSKKHNGFFYMSFSQLNQESYIINSDYKRYTGRFNFQQRVQERVRIGANLAITSEKNNALLAPKIYRDAILKAPNVPVYTEEGDYRFVNMGNPYGTYYENPLAMATTGRGEVNDTYTIANVYFDLELTNWLSYRFDFGINLIETDAISAYRNGFSPDKKNSIESNGYSRKWIVTNTINGSHSFEDHSMKFVLGQSFEQSRQKEEEVFFEDLWGLNTSGNLDLSNYTMDRRKFALASWFGRLNYNYKQKLFAGLSYRIDGSSRFRKSNRYQMFPAFSLGWIIKSDVENSLLNLFKLRSSFGYSGVEQSTYTYGALRTYQTHPNNLNYAGTPILSEDNGAELDISWEKTKNFDFGLDLSFFHEKLKTSLDYYSKEVNNLLLFTDVTAVSGYEQQWVNVGKMKNTGIEMNLDCQLIDRKFKWSMLLSTAYNKNEVVAINYIGEEVWGADQAYKYFKEGKEAAQFYLYDWKGVNPATGNPIWQYENGILSEIPPSDNTDRKAFGSGIPTFTGGINNCLSYKGFELNTSLIFVSGKKMMNGTAALLHTYSTSEAYNLSPDVLNYWKNEGDMTNQPALLNQSITSTNNYITSRTSSRFYEDASFIRLKRLVLAYYLPKSIVKKMKLEGVKFYAQATNLFTITNYSGVDPEVSAFGSSSLLSGYDEVTMPQSKSFSLGLRINL
ncbi:TonB-linked SusC/RagA family outer membrane protein [Ancylomarina subtilis]|uniref:TonB-linked SusC/RagA family outer membrane protein n=2 Tax=Ancylomarina subtilis TaxID=1639035 RepID=A0A4Q7VJ91_9BACT|nr:TonB-linked SusC/RagA family outer membrane protein [Ancylomarina subtilis]